MRNKFLSAAMLGNLASLFGGQDVSTLRRKYNLGRFSHSNGNGAPRKRKTTGRKARATAKRRARRNRKI
ncbi:MAG: hypothetical protein M3Q33_01420 [Acidobacteriota bacterium]|nr:hypothetical protein [Acidobacteriota bacterium]